MSQAATISLETLAREPAGTSTSTPWDEIDTIEMNQSGRHEFFLPPVDTGKDAWLFLTACFTLEALVWGFPFSFGVFQEYYSTHEPFQGSSSTAVIGTCSSGIMYLTGLPILVFNRLYPRLGRWSPMAGLLIICTSLAMSSFCTTVTQLIVTQGILYALGGSIAYMPCIIYLDEWFVKRKGLAYGIMWSGTGLGGVVLPLLLEYLLNTYGYKTTLRVWSVTLFLCTAPVAYFIKPRLPPSPITHLGGFNLKFALTKTFMFYQVTNMIEAVGFFLPTIFLPSYATSILNADMFLSALTLLIYNISSVVGCVCIGFLIDHFHVTTCILVSTIGSTIATLVLWGLSINIAMLYAFCIMYGFFAGSFSTTWPGIMREISTKDTSRNPVASRDGGDTSTTDQRSRTAIDHTMVFALLAAGRGIGNVVSGPISELLMTGRPWQGHAIAGYGSGYGSLIVFTGITALVGGSSFLGRRLGLL